MLNLHDCGFGEPLAFTQLKSGHETLWIELEQISWFLVRVDLAILVRSCNTRIVRRQQVEVEQRLACAEKSSPPRYSRAIHTLWTNGQKHAPIRVSSDGLEWALTVSSACPVHSV